MHRLFLMAGVMLALALPAGAQNRTAPTGGSVAVGTTATTIIPASVSQSAGVIGYQVQGTGWACASWATTTPTITGTDQNAVCGGAGSWLVGQGSQERTGREGIPSTPFTAIGAAGSNLRINWQVQ